MRRNLTMLLAVCLMLAVFCFPAYAVEYDFSGPGSGLFAEPTSDNTIYVPTRDDTNIDRSKTAAFIPPAFGSLTSYTMGAWQLLTPNLVNNGSTTNGAAVNNSNSATGSPAANDPSGDTFPPSPGFTIPDNPFINQADGTDVFDWTGTGFTDVTSDLYYSGGELGTLSISTIGLTVKVYQGTDNASLAKGAGHFTDTSIWDGNIAVAGHNRGVTNHFGKIHTLTNGDTITLTTKLGTRSYEVYSVEKISVDDVSVLDSTGANVITLITCVMDQPLYRWCVKAVEKA